MARALRWTVASFFLPLSLSFLAAGPSLLRVERRSGEDRTVLIRAGIPLVAEQEKCLLALGDAKDLGEKLDSFGYRWLLLDSDTEAWTYYMAGLRAGAKPETAVRCGEVLWTEDGWILLRAGGPLKPGCMPERDAFVRRLSLAPLGIPVPPPQEYALPRTRSVTPKPLVQEIVSNLGDATILGSWDSVISSATTRYSTSDGCDRAVERAYGEYSALGLGPYYQNHTAGHAPNVIGVMTGRVTPEKVFIVIGHIDDEPSPPKLAPGADDNASGAATATAAARALSPYAFANTVKFIDVTGEEFGLYGSTYYADNAHAMGEQIQAVLNADMIAWQGDTPGTEDLDLNYNNSSQWLGTLFADCASAYGTGCAVDAFLCPNLNASDHAPFWDNGYSAVCGITDNEGYCGHGGSYPFYHTAEDTKANCGDLSFFFGAVKAYVATLAHLAEPLCANPFPEPPPSLAAQAGADNHVALTWPSVLPGLIYEVYRAPGGCAGGYAAVKIGETETTAYDDASASGGIPYAYTVRTRKAQCVSDASACAGAATTGGCIEPPSFGGVASVANAAKAECNLVLEWAAAHAWCGGPITYRVYRSTNAPFTPSDSNRIAGPLSGTSYTDSGTLAYGTPYYYIVRASDAATGVEESNAVALSGVPTGPISIGTWGDDAGDTGTAKLTPSAPWQIAATGGDSGPRVYMTGPYGSLACAPLTGPAMTLGTGSQLNFWSKYDIENRYDKGQVEISEDGGSVWTRVPVNYPTTATHIGDSCALPAGQAYFTGTNLAWTLFTASLAAWDNKTIELRWRISSDVNLQGTGWWVDDISITNVHIPSPCTGGCSLACSAAVPATGTVGEAVTFRSTADIENCTEAPAILWTFGDGETSAEQNPAHAYFAAGSYNWTLAVTAQDQTCSQGGTVAVEAPCTVACEASAEPQGGTVPLAVSFASGVTPSNCAGDPVFAWAFGDGGTSSEQSPSHIYAAAGSFTWTLAVAVGGVSCSRSGTVTAGVGLPGDADGNGVVSIGEVQQAINMFLGTQAPGNGVDCNGDGVISIGEVQKVINGFLGLAASCQSTVLSAFSVHLPA